jgi:hypothetical protein
MNDEVRVVLAQGPPDPARELRGLIYLARMRVDRLEGAWPDKAKRNEHQQRAVAQARRGLALLLREARQEGVTPWRRRNPSP